MSPSSPTWRLGVPATAKKRPRIGGIDFNDGDEQPTFADFAYVAFSIAVTYGVTDTTLGSRAMRVTALQQALVSYLFGTVILAITVQVIGTLSAL